MSRYFVSKRALRVPSAWIDDDPFGAPMVPSLSVSDHEAVDTGLLDVHGDAIMRAPNPMGFGRDDEW